jgi:FkbM family methyltransferase
MNYKFIDIGCSYFDTSVDVYGLDVNGILVEPIQYYADLLPRSSTVFVEPSAISTATGTSEINAVIDTNITEYYTKSRMIKEIDSHNSVSKFEHWYEGGQSSFVDGHNISATKMEIKTLTLKDLFKKYNVTSVDIISIDTEGHDLVIFKQLYDLLKEGFIVNEKIIVEYYKPLYTEKEFRLFTATIADTCKKYNYESKFLQEYWNVDMILTKVKK